MLRRLIHLIALSIFCCSLIAAAFEGVWLDVPFVRQDKDGCGAASIAMVMQYWLKQQDRPDNGSADAEQIKRALFDPSARGIYASKMESYLKQNGFQTFSFRGEWKDLLQHLGKGRPLIVALKPAVTGASLHYVVVAGIDPEQGIVLLNDPAQRKLLKQDKDGFEKQWDFTGKWTLLALPRPTG
jgi:ABC-type bacteriocin/lantibiotic exporter with double-glycine peptidase domain